MNLIYQLIVNSIRAFQNIKSCLWSHHCMLASPMKFLKLLSWLKNDFCHSLQIEYFLATSGHTWQQLVTTCDPWQHLEIFWQEGKIISFSLSLYSNNWSHLVTAGHTWSLVATRGNFGNIYAIPGTHRKAFSP